MTGTVLPAGTSQLRFRGALLLIILLNVRIDGQLVTLTDALGDGTVGDAIVSPGVHAWSISNAADTAVLASGEIFCPECNPALVTVGPTVPPALPPTDAMVDEGPTPGSGALPVLAILLVIGIASLFLLPRSRTRR